MLATLLHEDSPRWMTWAVLFGIAFAVTFLGLWLGTLGYRRLPDDLHWAQRARLFWPLRVAKGTTLIWVAAILGLTGWDSYESAIGSVLGRAFAALLGAMLAQRLAWWGLRVPAVLKTGSWKSAVVLWTAVMPGGLALLVIFLLNLNRPLDLTAVAISVGVVLLLLVWCMGPNVWVMRSVGLLRPMNERARAIVDRVCQKEGVKAGGVYELDIPMVNAFAFPWTGTLAFTSAASTLLTDQQIEGVTAHELGHLRETPDVKWKRLLRLLPLAAMGLIMPMARSHGLIPAYALLLGAWLSLRMSRKWIRKAEEAADRCAQNAQTDEGAYAQALERLHEHNLIPAVLGKHTTHPDLYDRMIATGVTPSFPRPLPPERWLGIVTGALCALGAFVVARVMGV